MTTATSEAGGDGEAMLFVVLGASLTALGSTLGDGVGAVATDGVFLEGLAFAAVGLLGAR